MARRRLDAELVRRGLASDRAEAQLLVDEQRVLVSGSIAANPARQVDAGEALILREPPARFVGRGATKLDAALDRFAIGVEGQRCLDAGASTGGFTDALLQRGASEVVAVDVGYGQLHERLRAHPAVRSHERTNIRGVDVASIGGPFPVVVVDLSFISLRRVARDLVGLTSPGGDLVALVKPQFEASHSESSKGNGVIRDPEIWLRVVDEVQGGFAALETDMMGLMASPIRGAEGNREFLLHGRRRPSASLANAGGVGPSGRLLDTDFIRSVFDSPDDPVGPVDPDDTEPRNGEGGSR